MTKIMNKQDDVKNDTNGSEFDGFPPALSEYWKQIGKSHRHIASLLRANGNQSTALMDEMKRMGETLEKGLGSYFQNK